MFKGTLTALITPFRPEPRDNPAVDYDTLTKLVEWQIQSGVQGLVPCGTTAESVTLTHDEKISVIKRVMEVTKKRVPIIVGTGTNCTRDSVALSREVKELGADGVLVVSPYYNKPTQEGLYQHFKTVAEQGGLPVVLYNIPGRTAVEILPETFGRLAKVPGIVAVKEATGSAGRIMDIVEYTDGKLAMFAGDDNITYLVMSVGGQGVISASANVIPKEMIAITEHALNNRWKESLQAQVAALPAIRALFTETNPAPAKAALQMMGKIPHETLRLPLVSVKDETRAILKKALAL